MSNQRKLKFNLPKPDADKILDTAFGRGMAEVIAEKQARIDRLESMIWILYENVCRGINSTLLEDDNLETLLCVEILYTFKTKHKTLCELCRAAEKKNIQ